MNKKGRFLVHKYSYEQEVVHKHSYEQERSFSCSQMHLNMRFS
jgi:hypothetical protein